MCFKENLKKRYLITLSFLLFCLSPPALFCQTENIRFKRISIEDGLSQVSVNCIFQDKKGFMWFGTQDGLNRYDGYEFKIYRHNPADSKTIGGNFIWAINKASDGGLWIGTNGAGLDKFDPTSGIFTHYSKKDDYLNHDNVRYIYEDQSGVLWIGTNGGGLNRLDIKNKKFESYTTGNSGLSDNNIRCVLEDRSGILWIGTEEGGLNRFDRKNKEFRLYNTENSGISSNNVVSIYEDGSGMLWVGTKNGGLNKLNKKNGIVEQYNLENKKMNNNEVRAIYEDKEKVLWVGTRGGLSKLDQRNGEFVTYKTGDNPHGISDNDIRCIFEDSFGIVWIGTRGAGLNKFSRDEQFLLYTHNASNNNSLSHKNVMSIFHDETKGILWIGTFGGGLNKFDRNSEIITHYKHDKTNLRSLSHDEVRSIYQDKRGALWIGTYGGGLNKMEGQKFRRYNTANSKLSDNYIRAIIEDQSGILWIGTESGGLNKFDHNTGVFTPYRHSDGDTNSLSDNLVYCIYEDRSGVLWVGTRNGGLNKLVNREKMDFKHYKHDNEDDFSISNNSVLSIYEDMSGVLWIGTNGGLNKFDRDIGTFESYRIKDGLPNEVIYSILEDKEGILWMSTNQGLSRLDSKTEEFKSYDVNDGLQSNEFNIGACFKNHNGEMFFGGVQGFNIFKPGEIERDIRKPPTVITNFFITNEPVKLKYEDSESPLKKPIHETRSLTLPYNKNFFSFEFAALHYAAPLKNRYKYKLEGYNDEWIETDAKNRRATYTNLWEGVYTFHVKGSNKDGVWNEASASIKVKILPPLWRTWWAYAIYLLILAGLGFRFFRSKRILAKKVKERTKELNLKNDELEEKNNELKITQSQLVQTERMKGLGILTAGIAHEINNPTSFIKTSAYNLNRDLERLKNFLKDLASDDTCDEVISAFDERFNVIFNHIKIVQKSTVDISSIVRDLRNFSQSDKGELGSMSLQEGLQSTINLVEVKYKDQVKFTTNFQGKPEIISNPGELNQVFLNIIINACEAIIEKQKISNKKIKGTVAVQVREENDFAVIRFEDSGIGMNEDVRQKIFVPFFTTKTKLKKKGLGLSISYNIIKKNKGRIDVISEKGIGTTINLYFPLKKNN